MPFTHSTPLTAVLLIFTRVNYLFLFFTILLLLAPSYLKPGTINSIPVVANLTLESTESEFNFTSLPTRIVQQVDPEDMDGSLCFAPDEENLAIRYPVPCTLVSEPIQSPLADQLSGSLVPLENALNVTFNCRNLEDGLCEKAKGVFLAAGKILASVIRLKEPLRVNGTFIKFCDINRQCVNGRSLALGGGAPGRTFIVYDDDGMPREYPQALLKQMQSDSHLEYGPFDIVATFNAEFDWWFEGDAPIRPEQYDFLFVVVHELIHGLGMVSTWNDYVTEKTPKGLTPNPVLPAAWYRGQPAPFKFLGFLENAFDRYLVVTKPQMQKMTDINKLLNQLAFEANNTLSSAKDTFQPKTRMFSKIDDLRTAFYDSPTFELARDVLDNATKGGIGFLPLNARSNNDIIPLESSLSPFQVGSSIMHVDSRKYGRTPDFLMQWQTQPGRTLQTWVQDNGNFKGGPIGPTLMTILETLGFSINENPVPINRAGAENAADSVRCDYLVRIIPWLVAVIIQRL